MSLPVVAVVGRPNVGKSTLFNRLVGYRKAVVHDRPGVTRDRLYHEAVIGDRDVLLIDTGGLEPVPDSDLLASMRRQSLVAMQEADVIVWVVDARSGLTPADQDVVDLLRRSETPVVLAVNKVDGPSQEDLASEFWSLGVEPLLTVSAAHGRGIYELTAAIQDLLPEDERPITEEVDDDGTIRIAVVGRPNIGKSTLVNTLLGEDRHVVDDAAGTTMDPVDSQLDIDGQRYVLVDTAGVRKRARIDDTVERWVSLRAIRAIERCHITLLMIDGTLGPRDQDAKLAQLVAERGRALVVLVNKWDLAKRNADISSDVLEDEMQRKLPHVDWATHLFISAKTGLGVHRIFPVIQSVYASFNKRVPTSELNRFVEHAVRAHTPPQRHHHPVRIYYATQVRVRPPTFAFFANTPEGVGVAYQRYLANRLREQFGFDGTPLKLQIRRRRKLGEAKEG